MADSLCKTVMEKRKIMRAIMHVNIHAWPIAITGDLDG